MRRIEEELAGAKADQLELRRRLEIFETIASAAGAALPDTGWWGAVVPAAPMPTSLVAAAGEPGDSGSAVRLDVDGSELIAVIGGPGDPREWWSAMWHLAGSGAAS